MRLGDINPIRPLSRIRPRSGGTLFRQGFQQCCTFLLLLATLASAPKVLAADRGSKMIQSLIVVVGAGGNPQYEILFHQWSDRWISAAKDAGFQVTIIGRHRSEEQLEVSDHDQLREAIKLAESDKTNPLWIVLIGHGTFDRREAKFNLRGPDVSANEMAEWLKPVSRPTAIINCFSTSGAFISPLAKENRVVVTATKAGTEFQFSRFGDFLSQAINDPQADLDKDRQTSLWEAFLMASRKTAEFYDAAGKVVTEHAVLDDNGDRQGVRAEEFKGLVPMAKPPLGIRPDGRLAHLWHLVTISVDANWDAADVAKRNELELAIDELRGRKDSMSLEAYFQQLESLLVQLAELNEKSDP